MYVKLIDKYTVKKAPVLLRDDHRTYANPLPDVLFRFGYLPLVTAPEPEDGGQYERSYVSDGSSVLEVWTPVVFEPEEPEPVSEDENTVTESENETEI
jgi:hypothetical protein